MKARWIDWRRESSCLDQIRVEPRGRDCAVDVPAAGHAPPTDGDGHDCKADAQSQSVASGSCSSLRERANEVVHRREAPVPMFRQSIGDNGAQPRWNSRAGYRLGRLAPSHMCECRSASEKRFVQSNAKAELVGARVDSLTAELFGRHVSRRPNQCSRLRDCCGDSVPARFSTDASCVSRFLGEPREAEVHDADGAVASDHDVLRLKSRWTMPAACAAARPRPAAINTSTTSRHLRDCERSQASTSRRQRTPWRCRRDRRQCPRRRPR